MALEADSLHLGGSDDRSAGLWGRCYGVVPLFRFTGSNRPSVVHLRRSIDIDFPEIVSYPLRQRLMVHGAVADRTLPDPGVAAEEDGLTQAEEYEDIHDDVAFVDGDWNENDLDRFPLVMDTPVYRVPQFEQFMMTHGGLLAQRVRRRCVACVEDSRTASSNTDYE